MQQWKNLPTTRHLIAVFKSVGEKWNFYFLYGVEN